MSHPKIGLYKSYYWIEIQYTTYVRRDQTFYRFTDKIVFELENPELGVKAAAC